MQRSLYQKWITLARHYINDTTAKSLFTSIVMQYTEEHRHYHNLEHLEELFRHYFIWIDSSPPPISIPADSSASDIQPSDTGKHTSDDIPEKNDERITDPTSLHAIQFAIWFHDVIYDATEPYNNEEKSATWAEKCMQTMGVNTQIISTVKELILATKTHQLPTHMQSEVYQFFLDSDLAILGAKPQRYREYAQQIRKEYAIYADDVYSAGRKAALQALLAKPYIFNTNGFRCAYEERAQENMAKELRSFLK